MNPDKQRLAVMVAVSTLVLVLVLLFAQLRELKALVEERTLAPFEQRGGGLERVIADWTMRRVMPEWEEVEQKDAKEAKEEGGAP